MKDVQDLNTRWGTAREKPRRIGTQGTWQVATAEPTCPAGEEVSNHARPSGLRETGTKAAPTFSPRPLEGLPPGECQTLPPGLALRCKQALQGSQ